MLFWLSCNVDGAAQYQMRIQLERMDMTQWDTTFLRCSRLGPYESINCFLKLYSNEVQMLAIQEMFRSSSQLRRLKVIQTQTTAVQPIVIGMVFFLLFFLSFGVCDDH